MKVLAEGLFGYVRNGFNVFDGFIVVLRQASVVFRKSAKYQLEQAGTHKSIKTHVCTVFVPRGLVYIRMRIRVYAVDSELIFDCVTSLVELLQGGTGGLSVLRTFRLLRILKLVRFLPALRYQLFVMLKTMDNVATFFALLVLFIFIFRYLIHSHQAQNFLCPQIFIVILLECFHRLSFIFVYYWPA